jgi:hypothetical protein
VSRGVLESDGETEKKREELDQDIYKIQLAHNLAGLIITRTRASSVNQPDLS